MAYPLPGPNFQVIEPSYRGDKVGESINKAANLVMALRNQRLQKAAGDRDAARLAFDKAKLAGERGDAENERFRKANAEANVHYQAGNAQAAENVLRSYGYTPDKTANPAVAKAQAATKAHVSAEPQLEPATEADAATANDRDKVLYSQDMVEARNKAMAGTGRRPLPPGVPRGTVAVESLDTATPDDGQRDALEFRKRADAAAEQARLKGTAENITQNERVPQLEAEKVGWRDRGADLAKDETAARGLPPVMRVRGPRGQEVTYDHEALVSGPRGRAAAEFKRLIPGLAQELVPELIRGQIERYGPDAFATNSSGKPIMDDKGRPMKWGDGSIAKYMSMDPRWNDLVRQISQGIEAGGYMKNGILDVPAAMQNLRDQWKIKRDWTPYTEEAKGVRAEINAAAQDRRTGARWRCFPPPA